MAFAWKFLLPLALINLFITSLQVVFWPEAFKTFPWLIAVLNLVVTAVLVFLWSRFFRLGGERIEI
jgi:hypothetical protein